MNYQKTLATRIEYRGVGLHSGNSVLMKMLPAAADTGIVFVRTDLPMHPEVVADIGNVTQTMRATTLEQGSAKVFTVEHVLAALYLCGIDNCIVEMDSVEPPVGDGSSRVFVDLIRDAGSLTQKQPLEHVIITEPLAVEEPGKFIAVFPEERLRVSYSSFNTHPLLGYQYFECTDVMTDGVESFADARTIGFEVELELLKSKGLARGGSLENVLVFTDSSTMNTMRYPNELPRHKVLDIVGDMFLAGRIRGRIVALNSSHDLNTRLARKIRERFCRHLS